MGGDHQDGKGACGRAFVRRMCARAALGPPGVVPAGDTSNLEGMREPLFELNGGGAREAVEAGSE